MSILNHFPHLVTIQEGKGSRTASGAFKADNYVDVAGKVDVAAWVQKPKPTTVSEWEQRNQVISAVVFFPEDHSLNERNRILFGTRKLEVLGHDDMTAGLGRAFGAVCEEKTRRTT